MTTAPPSPELIVLAIWKLYMPMSPIDPSGLPL